MKFVKSETECLPRHVAPNQASMHAANCHHLWCIHCERAYADGDFRQVGSRDLCPYCDCAGAAAFAWDWLRVRQINPNYPREPLPGVVYPLFGRAGHSRRIGDRTGISR